VNGAFNSNLGVHPQTPAPEPTWVPPIDVHEIREIRDGLVQMGKIRASDRDGVLEIPLPTLDVVRPREVTIEVAKKD
jgi:hypothetical protein